METSRIDNCRQPVPQHFFMLILDYSVIFFNETKDEGLVKILDVVSQHYLQIRDESRSNSVVSRREKYRLRQSARGCRITANGCLSLTLEIIGMN